MAKERVVYDRIENYTKLRDIYLRHGINLTRFSTHEARKLLEILDTSNVQIRRIISNAKTIETKARYERIAREIRRITNEMAAGLDGQLEFDFMELAEEETRFVENAMRIIGVTADFDLPAPAKIWAAASFGTYSGYRSKETYESYLNTLGDNVFKTWDTNVRSGYLFGLTSQQINRAVLGSVKDMEPGQMQQLRRSLETNTRTMVSHLAETARTETYKKNSRLFSGYMYVGTLDSRTCLVCGSLDRKVFKGADPPEKPVLPQHPNCRCLWLPEIKGMEGFDDDDTRASVNGPVPAKMSYEDWLKTQPEDVQRDILGPSRFAAFKNGTDLGSFVPDGKTLTIEQLKQTIEFSGFTINEKWEDADGNIKTIKIEYGNEAGSIENRENSLYINEARRIEDSLKSYKYEVGTILDEKGNIVWQGSQGEYSSVSPPSGLVKDNIITHNHPMDGTFTPDDIYSFIMEQGLELRASTTMGVTYSLRRTETIDKSFYINYVEVVNEHIEPIKAEARSLGLSKLESDRYLARKLTKILDPWLLENSYEYGFIYTIENTR